MGICCFIDPNEEKEESEKDEEEYEEYSYLDLE